MTDQQSIARCTASSARVDAGSLAKNVIEAVHFMHSPDHDFGYTKQLPVFALT
jgi:hypothetical protein